MYKRTNSGAHVSSEFTGFSWTLNFLSKHLYIRITYKSVHIQLDKWGPICLNAIRVIYRAKLLIRGETKSVYKVIKEFSLEY